jgi:hypothetical protein
MTKDKALDLALEALESVLANHKGAPVLPWIEARDAIKQALEAPVGSEFLQAITDPENQPSQFGTVTLDYHFEKIKKWEELFERMSNKVLAQSAPVQEPVAYLCENAVGHKYFRWKKPSSTYKPIALYTTQPAQPAPVQELMPDDLIATYEKGFRDGQAAQRSWVGLTEKEIAYVATSHPLTWANLNAVENRTLFARILEAKLRERNT